jgi:hypothetical protein
MLIVDWVLNVDSRL